MQFQFSLEKLAYVLKCYGSNDSVSVYKKEALASGTKIFRCKNARMYGCPLQMYIFEPKNSDHLQLFSYGEHDHTQFKYKGGWFKDGTEKK